MSNDPHATQLQSRASSCHCKYMCIIENRQRGTPCLMIRKNPRIKMTRQADNKHLSNLLIYHGNMVLFSLFPLFIISFFFFFSFFSISYSFFIRRMPHRCSLWLRCRFPPCQHGLDQRPRRFSNTYT